MEYIFRLATPADIPQVLELYQSLQSTPNLYWDDEYPSYKTAVDDVKHDWLYVLTKGDEIVGATSIGLFNELEHLSWPMRNPCELARVAVKLGMHRTGIGTILLRETIEAAKAADYDGIRMLVARYNTPALNLYDKLGFTRGAEVELYDLPWYLYQLVF